MPTDMPPDTPTDTLTDTPTDTPTDMVTDPSPTTIVPLVVGLLRELVEALPPCEHRAWWARIVDELEPARGPSDLSPVRALIVVLGEVLLDVSGGCRCWPSESTRPIRLALVHLARVLGVAVFGRPAHLDDVVADAGLHVAVTLFAHRHIGRTQR